ncbi:MAG: hypothetical protein E6X17_11250 [Sporomusaceae bacterium]|nr:hypothetical protein [Sporomusaceae bacterium]
MAYVIACLAAAGAFLLNRLLLERLGAKVIVTVSPLVEETLKTLPAFYAAADILSCHLGFGVIEAVYDWRQSRNNAAAAALMSVAGHGLFGLVTLVCAGPAGIYVGLAAGMIAHLLWNTILLRWTAGKVE